MGNCVEKMEHSCGSRDGLQVFQDENGGYNGFCYPCNTYVADPYKDKPHDYKPAAFKKTDEEIQAELQEIDECPTLDLPDRKLMAEYLEYFGIKIGVSQTDGLTPTLHYYPYYIGHVLSAYKARLIENKAMWSVGVMKGVDLFGWQQAVATGAKTLYITEGELDAVALFQIFKEENKNTAYKDFNPAVVSLPTGSVSAYNVLSKMMPEIKRKFKEIVLVFDMDEAGRKAAEDVAKIFPDAKVAELPAKDVNACLIEGRVKACFKAVRWQASEKKNTRLVLGSSLREAARTEAEWGFSWPWKRINDATRGLRFGETIYIGSGVKMGKSEIVNAIGAHCIKEHGWQILMAKPEEANRKTYQLLVGKMAGKIFHDPKVPFDFEAYDRHEPLVGDNVVMLNLYQHLGWETLKADIYTAVAMGCKAVFIDPITNLTNQMGSAEANEALVRISAELAAMAMDLNIVVFIFCHLKAPTNGEPHERGGKIFSTQMAGSRAMMRSCNYLLGLEGNKDPALPKEQRNMRDLVILEDREFGVTERVPLYWDDKTGLFNEVNV